MVLDRCSDFNKVGILFLFFFFFYCLFFIILFLFGFLFSFLFLFLFLGVLGFLEVLKAFELLLTHNIIKSS